MDMRITLYLNSHIFRKIAVLLVLYNCAFFYVNIEQKTDCQNHEQPNVIVQVSSWLHSENFKKVWLENTFTFTKLLQNIWFKDEIN